MNHSHTTQRRMPAGLLLAITTLFGVSAHNAHCQNTFANPGDPQHRIAVLNAPSSLADYGSFEATFQVTTRAANLQLPYDPIEPPYAAHLYPDEDAAQGISVDGLFLPPGQNNWANAQDQPAFYFQGYDDNNFPTGEKDWKIRFAPNVTGVWQYRVRVADAQGVAMGAPQSFSVTSSSSHGFVCVSPTDSRYFQYSDGTPFLAAGDNDLNGSNQPLQNCAQAQAVALHRVWLAGNGGMQVVGGGGNNQLFQGVSFNPANAEPLAGVGHQQRFALALNSASAGIECNWANAKPGRPYTLTAWVKLQGSPGQHPQALFSWQSVGAGPQLTAPVADDGQWHFLTLDIAPGDYGQNFVVEMLNGATGNNAQYPFLLDDLCITDNATQEPVYGDIGMDWVTRYNQLNSAALDRLVSSAMTSSVPQYLKLTCFQHEDPEWGAIGTDGSSVTAAQGANAVGGSTDPAADTAVQRFQGYFARYLMARWGWSPAVMGVEHVNEGDPNSGIYFAGAQAFAKAVHSLTSDHYVLASTSGWNEGRGGYNWNFYQNWNNAGTGPDIYPDIDYADIHDYVLAGTTAYNTMQTFYPAAGDSVSATGGPNGLGMLTLTKDTGLPCPALRGAGTWTIKFYYKTSSDATFNSPVGNWYTHGGGQVTSNTMPNPYFATPPTVVPNWTEYTESVPVTQALQGVQLEIINGLLKTGTEYFADVRIYDPNGNLWMRFKFDEPYLLNDYAAYSEYLPLTIESYSGIPAIGKPLVIGETEPVGNDSQEMSDNTRARLDPDFDPNGNAVRQMAWGSIGSGVAIFQWWYEFAQEASNNDSWKYYGYVQKFLSDVPLSNGHYQNVDADASTPSLIAIGQKDTTAGRAYLYVYNRQANWDAIARGATITPVSGTVAITGLANGSYTVQRWNPGTGTVLSTETDVASGGLLTIPVNALAEDVALKISPSPAPVVIAAVSAPPTPAAPLSTAGDLFAYHSGGGAVGGFAADSNFLLGTPITTTNTIATTGVTGAGPEALYQTGRVGIGAYEFTTLAPNHAYTMRLHFAETQDTQAGQRVFSVLANGVWYLINFDVFKAAGGENKAVTETFTVKTTATGLLLIRFVANKGSTEINGIELHP